MMTVDLFDTLQHAWHSLCITHDVTADLPTVNVLFENANVSTPDQAAQNVLVNMLSEIMEGVGRFSPWYKQPASAFGVTRHRTMALRRPEWVLTPDAREIYAALLTRLATAIERNIGVILATQFVDDLDRQPPVDGLALPAFCGCTPPRTIMVHYTVIAHAEIICNACEQPFEFAGDSHCDHT